MDLNGMVAINMKTLELMDYYCDVNSSPLCRICLDKAQPNKTMCNIFTNTKEFSFSAMVMACASVQIAEGDGLPHMICESCIAKLDIAWEFKVLCESSDMKLRQLYSNQLQTQHTVECFPLQSKNDEYYGVKETDFILPNENLSENLIDSLPISQVIEEVQNVNENATEHKVKSKAKLNKQKQLKVHQCDTCGKIFNRREYLTQHIRIHTGEKPYKCHLCERKFVNSGHLITHMRTHTGEKPHSCTICPKTFSTRQELQKHTMVHNGIRPFECKSCGKSFGSSSNLYSHLKHHTGEKNFKCEHCGKAFYTKQELKQHFNVHTGEKAFQCKLCDKKFSQLAHLRRHSKTHSS